MKIHSRYRRVIRSEPGFLAPRDREIGGRLVASACLISGVAGLAFLAVLIALTAEPSWSAQPDLSHPIPVHSPEVSR